MRSHLRGRAGYMRIEILIIVAAGVLALQLSPALLESLLLSLDVRRWTRTTWFVANLTLLLILLAGRFGPDLIASWHSNDRQSKNKARRENY
jgi:hypothetical protein